MEPSNSKLNNTTSCPQVATRREQKQQKAARYVPPGRRASPTSTSSDDKLDRLWKPSVLPTNQPKVKVDSAHRTRGSNTSSQPRTRTPSPQAKSDTASLNSQTGEEVEVWQGKRRGGNRAPKIEPAGTKSWRDPERQGESGNDEISSTILYRLYKYSPFLLDAIDLHLNVLIRCIAPEAQTVSIRDIPRDLFPAINEGRLIAELCTKNYSMGLPGTISIMDFFKLLSVVVNEFQGVGLQHLARLVDSERISNSKSERNYLTKLSDALASLAVAQLNWESCRDLARIPRREDSPVPFEARMAIVNARENLLRKETLAVRRHFHEKSEDGEIQHLRDMEELNSECERGNVTESDGKMWRSCLKVRWCGLEHDEPPFYPHLLTKAGFVPGHRVPMQMRHAKEPFWMYDIVFEWFGLHEEVEEIIWQPNTIGANLSSTQHYRNRYLVVE